GFQYTEEELKPFLEGEIPPTVEQNARMCGTDAGGYVSEGPGLSVYALSDGIVYRTYVTTARGLEPAMAYYGLLDRTSKGRDESASEPSWIRSDDWRIGPELAPGDAEPLVEKSYGDSFEDTALETVLSGLGVGRLVVVGAQTDACIRSTLHCALVRGYDATLVSDAHTTEDQTAWGAPPPDQVIAHTNLYWTYQTAPGRTAGTVETKDVDFGGTS